MTVIERIFFIIKENGLDQNVVAQEIGKNPSTFNWYLRKEKRIDGEDIVPICKALGVTPDELFGFEPKNSS